MNLKLLKHYQKSNSILLDDTRILETEYHKSKYGVYQNVRYFIYDISANTREEILPHVYKIDVFRIVNAQYHSNRIYFVQYLASDERLQLISYDYQTKDLSILYTVKGRIEELFTDEHFTFFILNETYMIIQREFKKEGVPEEYTGFLAYESVLYQIPEQKSCPIIDENLVNNGMIDMIPVTENQVILKLGYDLMTDKRYQFMNKMNASVESINLVNVSQLISDLTLKQNGIILNSLDQAFYKQTMPCIEVSEDYLIYTKIDLEQMQELTTFYNLNTKDGYACLNKHFGRNGKYTKALIIDDKPYVRLNKEKKTDFYNLKSKKIDFSLYNDRVINNIIGDLVILTESKKSAFRKTKDYICIYRYPSMNLMHCEKGTYLGSLYRKESDTLFIMLD